MIKYPGDGLVAPGSCGHRHDRNHAAVRELVMGLVSEGGEATVTPETRKTCGRPVTVAGPERRLYKRFVPTPGALPSGSRDPPPGGGAVATLQGHHAQIRNPSREEHK
jgi:hypothetical protein